ncbi:MAG: Spy/CpxP family protein refolding chaperone [Planctomycetota bacterium]
MKTKKTIALFAGLAILVAGGAAVMGFSRPAEARMSRMMRESRQDRKCATGRGQGHGGDMERMRQGGCGRMGSMDKMHGLPARAEELDLEEEQVEEIRDLRKDWAMQRVDLTATLQKARMQLAETLRTDEVDMEEVEKQLDAVFQAKKELKLGKIRHRTEARDVLTEEQREKLGEDKMGDTMMGSHHGQKMQAPGTMHGDRRRRGRRGCPMMRQRPAERDEGHHDKRRGRGMRR